MAGLFNDSGAAASEAFGFGVGETAVGGVVVADALEREQLVGVSRDEHLVADGPGTDFFRGDGDGEQSARLAVQVGLVGLVGVEVDRAAAQAVAVG